MMVLLQICIAVICAVLCNASSLGFIDDDDDEIELLCDETSCEDYECPDTDECFYGEVLDVCQCCYICAKGPGEQCGGMFDLAGQCAEDYFCQPHPKYSQMPGVCVEFRR